MMCQECGHGRGWHDPYGTDGGACLWLGHDPRTGDPLCRCPRYDDTPPEIQRRSCCHSYAGDPHAGDCDRSPMRSEADTYAAVERAMRRADEFGHDEW